MVRVNQGGTIRRVERKSGPRWSVRFTVTDPATGERRETSRTFTSEKAALAFQAERAVDCLRGGDGGYNPIAGQLRLTVVWSSFERLKKREVREKTWFGYEFAWRRYIEPRWGRSEVGKIEAVDVADWLDTLGLGVWSQRSALKVLRLVVDHAVQTGLVRHNVVREVPIPRLPPPREGHRYLSYGEVMRLAGTFGAGTLGHDVTVVLALTGLRWSELVGLEWQDVDLERRRIHVRRAAVDVNGRIVVGEPKSRSSRRSVPLPMVVVDILAARRGAAESGTVFTAPRGGSLRITNFRQRLTKPTWNIAIQQANVAPLRIHDLRHTFASLSRSAGGDLTLISRTLGHASTQVTYQIYLGLFDDDLTAVADRLDTLG